MSKKLLTVGDIINIINYLESAKSAAEDTEKAKIDELTDKLKGMKIGSHKP